MAGTSPELTVWSPHPASGMVRLFRSLLERHDEGWTWVQEPLHARWIVIDAALSVNASLVVSTDSSDAGPKKIVLARNWAEIPDKGWLFFRIPLTEETVFPLLDQLLNNAPQDNANGNPDGAEPADGVSPWSGQRLSLRSWPNLSNYDDPHLRLVAVTRRMLMGFVPYEELIALFDDRETLDRMLEDAQRRGSLRTLLENDHEPAPAPSQPERQSAEETGSSIFQRFLEKFR